MAFEGTIEENLRYAKQDSTDEEIAQAIRIARLEETIDRLPDGLKTHLSENADNLSQGEKQLLTIARAILKDPQILILDEATSSVDTRRKDCRKRSTMSCSQEPVLSLPIV